MGLMRKANSNAPPPHLAPRTGQIFLPAGVQENKYQEGDLGSNEAAEEKCVAGQRPPLLNAEALQARECGDQAQRRQAPAEPQRPGVERGGPAKEPIGRLKCRITPCCRGVGVAKGVEGQVEGHHQEPRRGRGEGAVENPQTGPEGGCPAAVHHGTGGLVDQSLVHGSGQHRRAQGARPSP